MRFSALKMRRTGTTTTPGRVAGLGAPGVGGATAPPRVGVGLTVGRDVGGLRVVVNWPPFVLCGARAVYNCLGESPTAVGIIRELVHACRRGRKQHDIARFRHGLCEPHRLGHYLISFD